MNLKVVANILSVLETVCLQACKDQRQHGAFEKVPHWVSGYKVLYQTQFVSVYLAPRSKVTCFDFNVDSGTHVELSFSQGLPEVTAVWELSDTLWSENIWRLPFSWRFLVCSGIGVGFERSLIASWWNNIAAWRDSLWHARILLKQVAEAGEYQETGQRSQQGTVENNHIFSLSVTPEPWTRLLSWNHKDSKLEIYRISYSIVRWTT